VRKACARIAAPDAAKNTNTVGTEKKRSAEPPEGDLDMPDRVHQAITVVTDSSQKTPGGVVGASRRDFIVPYGFPRQLSMTTIDAGAVGSIGALSRNR